VSHVDEGTLHAYLDGECSGAEVAELEQHLAGCPQCRNALAAARDFLKESDGLILALDVASPELKSSVAAPVARRNPRLTTLAWAASIIAAVGLGYTLRNSPIPSEATPAALDEGGARLDQQPPALQSRPSVSAPSRVPSVAAHRDAPATPEPARIESKAAVATQAGSGAGAPPADALDATRPAPQVAPAAVGETRSAAPANLALVNGVPADTTAVRHLFGPEHTPAPRRITMDEAVTHLGGSIRLIDGLTPQRVELLAGVDVPGADPAREVVRIYYEEPDLGLVTLDQQRPGPSFAARRDQADIAPESVTVSNAPSPARPGLAALDRSAMGSISWRRDGTWMSLTSRLSKDQMASLQARVK
jgi:anti-sigma factor RsiW